MANVLAVPPTKAPVWSVSVSPPVEMEIEAGGVRSKAFPLEEAGRYIIAVDFEGPETRTARLKVITTGGTRLAFYEAPISHLKQRDCSDLVFEVDAATKVICGIEGGDLRGVILKRVVISRVYTGFGKDVDTPGNRSEEEVLRDKQQHGEQAAPAGRTSRRPLAARSRSETQPA